MTESKRTTQRAAEAATVSDELAGAARAFMRSSIQDRYSYNFHCLGRPIIQYPQDMVAVQELIWELRPDVVFETGIAHGGSLMLSASALAMLDYCDAAERGEALDPKRPKRVVVGVDIDIREHNRAAILAHPMASRIEMIQGSSIDPVIVEQVRHRIGGAERVLVFLDSNHTHDHVLAELEAYAQLSTVGSYCVVFDTVVEDLPAELYPDRPWRPGNSPKSAAREFLKTHPEFVVDEEMDRRLLVSVAPGGYLKRVA